MLVAAAHVPTYGTFSSWKTGSMASPTGECRPPNTATAFSRSITSRAAVTPLPGLPSSSRITSSSFDPPSTPPLALISSMATVSPRLMASPDSADPPDVAATSATFTGGLPCVHAVAATANTNARTATIPSNIRRVSIRPPRAESSTDSTASRIGRNVDDQPRPAKPPPSCATIPRHENLTRDAPAQQRSAPGLRQRGGGHGHPAHPRQAPGAVARPRVRPQERDGGGRDQSQEAVGHRADRSAPRQDAVELAGSRRGHA